MSKRFWNWLDPDPDDELGRVLRINGPIAEDSWFDDDITPRLFAAELNQGSGQVTIWLNSPGGDVIAAAQIYNLLLDYPGSVIVNIDGVAASAASVIAMAATKVCMSPVSMMMIHNPATLAVGDESELGKAIDMLASVKESIINAYQLKTGLSRAKLSKLMDAETWMDARAAIRLGFADELLTGKTKPPVPDNNEPDDLDDPDFDGKPPGSKPKKNNAPPNGGGVLFSRRATEQVLVNKLAATQLLGSVTGDLPGAPATPPVPPLLVGRRVVDLYSQLTTNPSNPV